MNHFYKPSGRFGPLAIPLSLVSGALAAVILAYLYSYAVYYIPFVYLNFFLTLGLGLLVGGATGIGGMLGKSRSGLLGALGGVVTGVFAVYFSWVVYVHIVFEGDVWVFEPAPLFDAVLRIAEEGVWQIRSIRPTGIALYIVWTIEALIIVGGAGFLGAGMAMQPFCEACGRWVDDEKKIRPLSALRNPGALKRQLEAGDMSQLRELTAGQADQIHSVVQFKACPDCSQFRLISVQAVSVKKDNKGKIETSSKDVAQDYVLSNAEYTRLMNDLEEAARSTPAG